MNPVFWVLIILAAVALWFFLRRIFFWLGTRANNVIIETKKALNDEGKENKEDIEK